MTKTSLCVAITVVLTASLALASPRVKLETTMGTIVLELDEEKAPKTVENFLIYAQNRFYDGTIFHRVIDNFMIQGGGFTENFEQKTTRAAIENEAANGLKNTRGSIAMARTPAPHSATSQFFINVKDNGFLDHIAPTEKGWGYAVFGKVIDGMEVVDKIRRLPTGPGGPFPRDVPQTPVVIQNITVVTAPADANTNDRSE